MVISHVSKFKKQHKQKIRIRSQACKLREPTFGTFAIRTKEASRFTEWQFETVQKTLRRGLKKNGFIWFVGTPNVPISAKPTNIRMGKGKGAVSFWAQIAPTGSFLVEGAGPNRDVLARAANVVKKKIPTRVGVTWVRTKLHR